MDPERIPAMHIHDSVRCNFVRSQCKILQFGRYNIQTGTECLVLSFLLVQRSYNSPFFIIKQRNIKSTRNMSM
jgi:hypothetical protein